MVYREMIRNGMYPNDQANNPGANESRPSARNNEMQLQLGCPNFQSKLTSNRECSFDTFSFEPQVGVPNFVFFYNSCLTRN